MVHLRATALVLAGSIAASNARTTQTFRDNIKNVVVLIQENRLAVLPSARSFVFAHRIHDYVLDHSIGSLEIYHTAVILTISEI